jgi:inner membrane protein
MKHPLLVRAAVIAAIAFAILLPLQLIRGKVVERQQRAQGVQAEFAAETSGEQVIIGPFLAVTCEETYTEEREIKRAGKAETITEARVGACPTAYFTPRTFEARANLPVQSLHRGIYPIRMFRAAMQWQGEVDWPAQAESTPTRKRKWKQVYLVSKVKDPRGVKTIQSKTSASLLDGLGEPGIESFTLREGLGAYESRRAGEPVAFSYEASIAGMGSFQVAPVGDHNEIRIASNWPHPSFSRGWSPDERQVGDSGFVATWRIDSVATGGNAAWKRAANAGKLDDVDGAGVSLFDPVNVYSLSYRATEYSFLFVLFTFAAFAATEVLARIRLHPVQYGLVGCALAVFFLLLLALSEHIAFAAAYGSAAFGCSALMAFYLKRPLGSALRALGYFAGFIAMYATLYAMLQSEDNALLVGSLLVFALLAAIMITTRGLDWSRVYASAFTTTNSAGIP